MHLPSILNKLNATLTLYTIVQGPVGMVVDHTKNRLYWVDRIKGTVESVDLDGQDRTILFTVENTQFFGISLHQVWYITIVIDNIKRSNLVPKNFTIDCKNMIFLLYDWVLLPQIWTILPWEITKTIFHCFPI